MYLILVDVSGKWLILGDCAWGVCLEDVLVLFDLLAGGVFCCWLFWLFVDDWLPPSWVLFLFEFESFGWAGCVFDGAVEWLLGTFDCEDGWLSLVTLLPLFWFLSALSALSSCWSFSSVSVFLCVALFSCSWLLLDDVEWFIAA